MVELVGVMPDVDEWPSDMDARVAALDFGDSMLSSSLDAAAASSGVQCGDSAGEDSSFDPSLSTFDPSLSTDSLDSEQLRARCAVKKDDYKLTFADSGQWTSTHQFTTWGRIQYTQPLDEKVVSAPDVTNKETESSPSAGTALHSTSSSLRPSSLLLDFVGRQLSSAGTTGFPTFARNNEAAVGADPRLVDVNENDIEEQRSSKNATANFTKVDRWRNSRQQHASRPSSAKTRRTFADLAEPPELRFLALPHEMRALCESRSMPEALGGSASRPSLNLSDIADVSPDSGLGCSGPVHIEDWPSLSVLLPRHVAEACSFFKRNSDLLNGSASNCVERSSGGRIIPGSACSAEPCTTCFRVRRRFHPPVWAHSPASRLHLCDCASSEIVERPSTLIGASEHGLRSRELSVVGLPVYAAARRLVEAIVEGVAASVRGEGEEALSEALTALLVDGLKSPHHPWDVIRTITAPGPATKNVYDIVTELAASDRSNDAKVHVFLEELQKECSVECWLCYVLLKENVLRTFYRTSAFLISAPSAYRSLLSRLLESLQLIAVHHQKEMMRGSSWGKACRLASDSRVPKSSSVPARLSPLPPTVRRRSRIPQPKRSTTVRAASRSALSAAECAPTQAALEARVRADSAEPGQLVVKGGELVRVLSRRGQVAHCCRLRHSSQHVTTGIVPLNNLLLI